MAVACILNFCASFFLSDEPSSEGDDLTMDTSGTSKIEGSSPEGRSGFAVICEQPMILVIYCSTFLQYFAYSGVESFGAVFMMLAYGADEATYGLLAMLCGFVYLLTLKVVFKRVLKKFGERSTAQLGHAARAVGYFVFALGSSLPWAACFFTLIGCGAVVTPSNDSSLQKLVSNHQRGFVQGLNAGLASLARTIGPIVAA